MTVLVTCRCRSPPPGNFHPHDWTSLEDWTAPGPPVELTFGGATPVDFAQFPPCTPIYGLIVDHCVGTVIVEHLAMVDLDVPAVGFATNIRTISDRAIKRPLPRLLAVPESDVSRRPTIDPVQQRWLWWLVSMILVVCGSNGLALRAMGVEVVIHSLFIGGTVAALVTVLRMWWMAGTRRVSRAAAMVPWLIISAGVCSSILYFGVF